MYGRLKIYLITILTLILFLNYYFFNKDRIKPNRYKVWYSSSNLESNDFLQGTSILPIKIEKSGTEYEVGGRIITFIRLIELNDGTPKAYTIMDRYYSWLEKSYNTPYGLKHELYHIKITELGTQLLNNVIQKEQLNFEEAQKKKEEIDLEMYEMQKQYDDETLHSIHVSIQHQWEYKIDSILSKYKKTENIDAFSGVTAFFADQPSITIERDSTSITKRFHLDKYGSKFDLNIHYDVYVDTTNLTQLLFNHYVKNKFDSIQVKLTSHDNYMDYNSIWLDTIENTRYYEKIIIDDSPNYYRLRFSAPQTIDSTLFYHKSQKTFFNSFQIKDQRAFWMDKIKHEDAKKSDTEPSKVIDKNEDYRVIYTGTNRYSLIYHLPFINDRKLILPFKIERHSYAKIDRILLKVNNSEFYAQTPDTLHQIIQLDISKLNKGINRLQFGYLLNENEGEAADYFYSSTVDFWLDE